MAVRETIEMRRAEDKTLRFSVVDPTVKTMVKSGGDGIDEEDTTIGVVSTSAFGSTGRIKINHEVIPYTGKTSSTFTGCTRGGAQANGGRFAAEPHNEGADVYQVPDVTGWTTEIDVRETAAAVSAAIEKAGSVLAAADGLIDVTLAVADTSALTPDRYVFEFRRTDSLNAVVLTHGPFKLLQEVSR